MSPDAVTATRWRVPLRAFFAFTAIVAFGIWISQHVYVAFGGGNSSGNYEGYFSVRWNDQTIINWSTHDGSWCIDTSTGQELPGPLLPAPPIATDSKKQSTTF